MNVWCKVALWFLLTCGIYGDMGAAEENLRNALLVLRHSLTNFYKDRHAKDPLEQLTRISDLTTKMVGTRAEQKCKTKGADTWGVLLFFTDEMSNHALRLGARGCRLLAAGKALERIVSIWGAHGRIIPARAIEDRLTQPLPPPCMQPNQVWECF